MSNFEKMKISLRYWLLGMSNSDQSYLKCVDAFEFAQKFHTGVRKDGFTPEFEHQLVIALYIRTLIKNLEFPSETICVSLLHDVSEDYNVSYEELLELFGYRIASSIEKLTKVFRGIKKNEGEYFRIISECPISSIAKGADRIHNLQTMMGAFTQEKQKSYVKEAMDHIIPSLKVARRNFPKQELAYENIKLVMNSQIQLISSTWVD